MKFEELQQEWQAMECELKSPDELLRMIEAPPLVWRLKNVSAKKLLTFCWRAAFITAVIIVFDLFGSWTTGIFAAWGIVTFLDDHLGFLNLLRLVPQENTIKGTLVNSLISIKRFALVSGISHGVMWMAAVVILGTHVEIGPLNVLLWAFILLPLLIAMSWWNSRRWSHRIAKVKGMLEEYDAEQRLSTEL
jgi:hypothetical protein